jgi:transcriptional regulator with XRE-family HTH domain
MPYNSKAFGIVISRLRTEKVMSQENLSAFAGIARSHLTMLENGRKTARLNTVFSIADALGIKPSELIRMVEEADNKQGE